MATFRVKQATWNQELLRNTSNATKHQHKHNATLTCVQLPMPALQEWYMCLWLTKLSIHSMVTDTRPLESTKLLLPINFYLPCYTHWKMSICVHSVLPQTLPPKGTLETGTHNTPLPHPNTFQGPHMVSQVVMGVLLPSWWYMILLSLDS